MFNCPKCNEELVCEAVYTKDVTVFYKLKDNGEVDYDYFDWEIGVEHQHDNDDLTETTWCRNCNEEVDITEIGDDNV